MKNLSRTGVSPLLAAAVLAALGGRSAAQPAGQDAPPAKAGGLVRPGATEWPRKIPFGEMTVLLDAPQAEVRATPVLLKEQVDQFVPVALEEGAPLPEEEVDISGWELDAELAGMTDQEKNVFLNQLHQRKKDGSCVEEFSFCSWG